MAEKREERATERLAFWGRVLFVALLLCGVWQFLFVDRAVVELTAEADDVSLFKIYYSDSNGGWSEWKMHEALLEEGENNVCFRLANLRHISGLRIDPAEREGTVIIRSLILRQSGYQPIDIVELAKKGSILRQTGIARFDIDERGIVVVADTNDPNFFFTMPELIKSGGSGLLLLRLLLLCVFAWLLVKAAGSVLPQYGYVPWAMLLVVVLAAVMAGTSAYNTHPDEAVHVAAAQYYIDNTLPPAVGDPRAEGTYSGYGYSRLYSGEIAYLFAGKFAALLQPLDIPDYLAFRYFNLALLVVLFCCACRNTTWRLLLIPLLLSPQIWYIFSYWNSEGLALFLVFCTVWQLVARESTWNRVLAAKTVSWALPRAGGLVLLLTLLFLCKKNFYFFILFAGIFVLHQFFFRKIAWNRRAFWIVSGIVLCAVTLFGSYRLWNAAINDFQFSSRVQEQVRMHASPLFNPDTPLAEQFPNLYMKERGVSFAEMVASRWGERCFCTSVGTYGYTSVSGPFNYYHYMRYGLLLLGAAVVVSVLFRGSWESSTLMLLTIGTGVGLTAISFYHSWTMDYQAQGRYLLPVVGMFSLFVCQVRRQLENIVVVSLAALIFSGALYSFLFVALAGIGKVTSPF